MKDALIIGGGIAGTTLSFQLLQRGWTFDLVDHVQPHTASKIASGLYNPLVLKRRRVVWKATEMLATLPSFYSEMEKLTHSKFLDEKPVWEVLHNPGVENDWMALSDLPRFQNLIGDILPNTNPLIHAHKIGEVAGSGRVDVSAMILAWGAYLEKIDAYQAEKIEPDHITFKENKWHWKNRVYDRIIWTKGFDASHPHFPNLPFSPTKGEVIIVHSPELKLDHILHAGVFIMPLGDDLYKVGATYSWDPLDQIPSAEGQKKLIEEWGKLTDAPFEIVEHLAGIRPNVKDRKPLLGRSNQWSNSYIFNGLGSRGILMAPWLSEMMFQFMENGTPLLPEVDINRFS